MAGQPKSSQSTSSNAAINGSSSANTALSPPFSSSVGRALPANSLPHSFTIQGVRLDPELHLGAFLETELHPSELEKVHPYLWLAGLARPARSLQRQGVLGRTIQSTDRVDEHLLWHGPRIFIKPLPEYLLDHTFWKTNLCNNASLRRDPCGLLLSYSWLVCTKSDLSIAHDHGLVPADIDFPAWTSLMLDFLKCIDTSTLSAVSPRYHYGELRLTRVNKMFRLGLAGFTLRSLVWGFMPGSTHYTDFFQRNFGWIVVVFVYVSVVLSALQVALGTERFQGHQGFQAFSYGFALFSMATIFLAVLGMFLVWWTLFWFHLLSTWRKSKAAAAGRRWDAQGRGAT